MCCEPRVKKRIIAAAVLSCFIIVSLFSHLFILTHADHEHDYDGAHGSCAACAQIENAGNTLKQIGMAVVGLLPTLTGLLVAAAIIRAIHSKAVLISPVVLKIRMNN